MSALWRPSSVLLRGRAPLLLASLCRRYSTDKETIGFIGLGNMGRPMALNLLKSGRQLVAFDTVQSSMEAVVSEGAVPASSPADVARRAGTIVTMLPAGENVRECYLGDDGLLSSASEGCLFVDSSTTEHSTAKEVGSRAEECGVNFLDAPVSGGIMAAQNALLTFMVGGEEGVFKQVEPLLSCMGKNVIHCGPLGSGQATKVCNNMLLAVSMIGVSEAIQLGKSLGLDPKRLSSVINMASGRCWSSDTYNPCPGVLENVPSSNGYKGGFQTPLMSKDLGLALDAANDTKTITPMGALANQIYRLMLAQGYAGKDFSSVFEFLEKQN